MAKKYTREQLIEIMKDYIDKYGIPTTREFDKKAEYPSTYTYIKGFGSFQNAIRECGFFIPKDKINMYNRRQYSKEELLEYLKEENRIHLKNNLCLMTAKEIDKNKNMPTTNVYYKHFKTLKEAYFGIGINYNEFNKNRKIEDLKEKYIKMKNILNRPPTSRDMDRFVKNNKEYYASRTYTEYFGSIEKVQILMGDAPTNYSRVMTDEEMLNGLIKLKDELGIVPTQKEVEMCDYCGSISDYCHRFGSFVNSIIKAGMTPRSKKKPLITPCGNRALSGYEYKFMLMLEEHTICFEKEEYYKTYIKDFNKNYRFDFTISIDNEKYFVEIFGITGNEDYNKKTKEKIKLCKDNNLKLIEFYPDDIGKNLFDKIYKMLIDSINKLKEKEMVI